MKQRTGFSWVLTVLLVLACTGGTLKPASAEELTFGMSAAFSGPSRGLGIEYYRGVMAYLSHVNGKGGVNGHTFAIKAYDDGYNPEPCVRNTIRLIERDNVFALLNYVGTPTTTRMLPLLKKYADEHFHLLFPFTGARPLRTPPYDQYVFNLRASYMDETIGLVDHFVWAGRERVAVFYQADAYGRNGWEGVRMGLAGLGLSMVGEAAYQRGAGFEDDYSEAVDILAGKQPDAIVMVGSYAACAGFVRDARDKGIDVPIASVSFSNANAIVSLLSGLESSEDGFYTDDLIFSNVVPSYEDSSLPAVRLYRQLMSGDVPMPPESVMDEGYEPHRFSNVSFEGFLNGMLLVEMVRRMGVSPQRKRIPEIMHTLDGFDIGLAVPVRFSGDSNQGLNVVYYSHVADGRLLPIRDWQRWKK